GRVEPGFERSEIAGFVIAGRQRVAKRAGRARRQRQGRLAFALNGIPTAGSETKKASPDGEAFLFSCAATLRSYSVL
ncbi:MAG: hypothetical protein OEY69_05260, partial [Candidatus Krumholzibacteria bacterium]|nr:hypothetical protein [Candidatus Krumholzibacteria bacterium]